MTASPRILKIVSHFHPGAVGGAEGQARVIGRELARRGSEVTVLTLARPDAPAEETFEGMRIIRGLKPLALGPLWGWTYARQTAHWLRRLAADYDLVHTHQVYLHTAAAVRARAATGKPVVCTVVCGGDYNDFARLAAIRGGRARLAEAMGADRMIAVSGDLARETAEAGYPAERTAQLPYMVDTEHFSPPEGGRDPNELLFVGRLAPQKNLGVLLEAFAGAQRKRPELRLTLVGDGPARGDIEADARRLGIEDRVTFEGFQTDVRPWLRRAGLSITASAAEGLSNALLEALACGIPIVASDACGNPEIVGEGEADPRGFKVGEAGLLAPADRADAFEAAILHATANPELLRAMSDAARRAALERYGIDRVIERYLDLYREVLSESRAH